MRRRDRKEVMTTGTRAVQRGGVQGVLKLVGVGLSWSKMTEKKNCTVETAKKAMTASTLAVRKGGGVEGMLN